MKVKVCDAIMGSGKTQAAIVKMDRCVDRRYMFITPYLNECERVCAACESAGSSNRRQLRAVSWSRCTVC